MIRRFHEAKVRNAPSVTLWGTGTPRREFMHVDDLARAALFLLEHYDQPGHVNVGVGEDVTVAALAATVAEIVGYDGRLTWDTTKPDGTPRKLLDVTKINELGWKAEIDLSAGIRSTYEWYLSCQADAST
jgi:GDP-L-fucose synthase